MATAKYKRNYRGVFETKVWDGTYDENGMKHRKCLSSSKSSADLERQVNNLRNKVQNGQYVRPTDIQFISYAQQWLDSKKAGSSKNTRRMYQNIIDTHLSFLAGMRLIDIRNTHFQLAINNSLDKPRTCQQIYITFRQILSMAVADNYIGVGIFQMICSDINLPKYIKSEKRPLTQEELEAFRKVDFTPREKAFVWIIFGCGLRRGEALALSKFDFKEVGGKYFVSITKSLIFDGNSPELKDPKTDNGFRDVPIPSSTAVYLKSYISSLRGTQLFTCTNGSLITKSSYDKMWRSIFSKINYAAGGTDIFPAIFGLTAHIFRHNYCTNLCYSVPQISIKKIAQLMGDTEKVVLDTYNHIMEEKEDPSAVVNDVFAI